MNRALVLPVFRMVDHHTAQRQEWLRQQQTKEQQLRADLDRKRAAAIAYLRERGKYVLDRGSFRPPWGVVGAAHTRRA